MAETTATIEQRLRDTFDRRLKVLEETQKEHHKTLFGNGEPGLDEQIRNVIAWITEQKEQANRRRAWWDKLQWVIVPIVISGLIAFFYQVFVFYFQIVPLLEALK